MGGKDGGEIGTEGAEPAGVEDQGLWGLVRVHEGFRGAGGGGVEGARGGHFLLLEWVNSNNGLGMNTEQCEDEDTSGSLK